jgi:hypothetical protein
MGPVRLLEGTARREKPTPMLVVKECSSMVFFYGRSVPAFVLCMGLLTLTSTFTENDPELQEFSDD